MNADFSVILKCMRSVGRMIAVVALLALPTVILATCDSGTNGGGSDDPAEEVDDGDGDDDQNSATAPLVPGDLTVTGGGLHTVNLSWTDNSDNELNFLVGRSATSGGSPTVIATIAADTTTYADTTLDHGQTAYYCVKATNVNGASAWCPETSGTAPTPVWATEQVAGSASPNTTSIALDTQGYPAIVYATNGGQDATIARWDGAAWQTDVIDTGALVLDGTSLAFDSSGTPHVAFHRVSTFDVEYGTWDGATWSSQVVHTAAGNIPGISLAVDSQARVHIAAADSTSLLHVYWDGASWQWEMVAALTATRCSLAIDESDNYHVSLSYQNGAWFDLQYSRWDGAAWNTELVEAQALSCGIAVDSSGSPHIVSMEDGFQNMRYQSWTGATWATETVDASTDVGSLPAIAIDASDNTHLAYYDGTNGDLKYARWNGSAWTIQTVETTGDVGSVTSIALDSLGDPHISYFDTTNTAVKYAHLVAP